MERWTSKEARDWARHQPWICGFNFLPSSAVNFIDMWHRDTFDPATIERELGWAANLGYNAFRINLSYIAWKHDRDGLLDRLDRVMSMANRFGIRTVPVPFDDCGFGGAEPTYGVQPDPIQGVHNSRAVASPGRALLHARSDDALIRDYVRDLITDFRTDPRVLFWDLYNEPGNRMIFRAEGSEIFEPDFTADSLRLVEDSFRIAREIGPEHPLTVGAWTTPIPGLPTMAFDTCADRLALENSDILSFHAYLSTDRVESLIEDLSQQLRPVFCTEWMARAVGSDIRGQLHLFKSTHVGCFQWGLVRGRTQTWLPWPADLVSAHGGDASKDVWFHDLLHDTGAPFDEREIETLRQAVELTAET